MRGRAGAKPGLLAGAKPSLLTGAPLLALLSALTLCPALALAASPTRGVSLGFGGAGGVAFARSPYWDLNVQPWYSASLSFEAPVVSVFGLGFTLGLRGAGSSAPANGVLYKGHHGLEAGACLYGKGRLVQAERLDLLGGIIVGSSANFEVYNLTELLYFYPSILVEPFLEFHFLRLKAHTFSLTMPGRLDFRRDMDLSASLGLGLRWRWYPAWREKKK